MRDVENHAFEIKDGLIQSFRKFLGDRGYSVIETPLLEETDLFVRKSGGELTSRLYTFTDPGGHQVSLRPEFTSSVIRHFIEGERTLTVPVRWQYAGPVFRYDQGASEEYRQFTQVGAEFLGESGVTADVEIACLAWAGLRRTGLDNLQFRLGHLGAVHSLLESFRLSDSAKLFIVSNIQDLKSGQSDVKQIHDRAEAVGLLRAKKHGIGDSGSIASLNTEEAEHFVQEILRDSMPAPVGRRTTEQIVERLLRKIRSADDSSSFNSALSAVNELVALEGSPQEVLAGARELGADRPIFTEALTGIENMLDLISDCEIPQSSVVLDFGLARGISYYTGVIFELIHSIPGSDVSLGGGGRYDGLVKALGGERDVPALGFAYTLDALIDVLDRVHTTPSEISD